MEIMFVRHTEVGVQKGIIYGRTDVPLADSFALDRELVRERIQRFWPDGQTRIVSSPATRCRQLSDFLGPVERFDDRLWEVGFGSWEMRQWNDVDRTQLDAWMADFVTVRPPSGALPGEHLGDLAARVGESVDEMIAGMQKDDRLLVVAHGAVIRAALAGLLDIPLHRCFDIEISKGSITRVGFRGRSPKHRPHILGVNLL
jgi:alpha-ribazole phosphatase